jgi:uncharacterized protein YeaO (DUF488 family)
MAVRIKRIYEEPSKSDGTRILVDRLWPRGMTKVGAALTAWLRDLAPSNELRKWFHARDAALNFATFRKRYLLELRGPEAADALAELYERTSHSAALTLLTASKEERYNHAVVLRDLLSGMRKPPASSGPARAVASRKRMSARPPR